MKLKSMKTLISLPNKGLGLTRQCPVDRASPVDDRPGGQSSEFMNVRTATGHTCNPVKTDQSYSQKNPVLNCKVSVSDTWPSKLNLTTSRQYESRGILTTPLARPIHLGSNVSGKTSKCLPWNQPGSTVDGRRRPGTGQRRPGQGGPGPGRRRHQSEMDDRAHIQKSNSRASGSISDRAPFKGEAASIQRWMTGQ